MSDHYTHIGIALSNAKFVILLSAKPLAIDQIQIVKDKYEVMSEFDFRRHRPPVRTVADDVPQGELSIIRRRRKAR